MFTAPTAIRAIKQQDSAGEHLAPPRPLQARGPVPGRRAVRPADRGLDRRPLLGKPIVDHWWQTETGWAITSGFRGFGLFPLKPGSGGRATPGFDVPRARRPRPRRKGARPRGPVRRPPAPAPGCPPDCGATTAGSARTYLTDYPGSGTSTGDAGLIDAAGDVFVMGRTDDIINVTGHRLSTGAIEEVLTSHPDVAECAVVGAADALKGQDALRPGRAQGRRGRDEAEVAAER